ncbi:hypothetical protein [Streptomyces himastatinicus]|uniref:hypothetical protein n=1 Tax=Streptomyces himastatinicus TaxID=998084 RepID=UPI00031A7FB9|nr:hypothetical protein [Streptomyces himastatinicus]
MSADHAPLRDQAEVFGLAAQRPMNAGSALHSPGSVPLPLPAFDGGGRCPAVAVP